MNFPNLYCSIVCFLSIFGNKTFSESAKTRVHDRVVLYKDSKYFWSFDNFIGEGVNKSVQSLPAMLDNGIRVLEWLDLGPISSSCIITPYHCKEGFTISFWMKMNGMQEKKMLLNITRQENAIGAHLYINHGRLRFSTTGLELDQDIVARTATRYVDTEYNFEHWTHVALMWKSIEKEMQIFLNCSEADYISAGILFDRSAHIWHASRQLIIGATNTSTNRNEASFDELSIWDKLLEKHSICSLFNTRTVHGQYDTWSEFTKCSKTCGIGMQTRYRTCSNPVPQYGGRSCNGESRESRSCFHKECPINGGFSEWSKFSNCSESCSGGYSVRMRTCTKPVPQYGGQPCEGAVREIRVCNLQPCPIHGGYSDWSKFTPCTKSCENGTMSRMRVCNKPEPANQGRNCSLIGPWYDVVPCNDFTCPIHGGYTAWSQFTPCSVSCGTGVRKRTRNCTNPTPQHGGNTCDTVGPSNSTQACNTHHCPVNGGYTNWSEFTTCSKSCGNGTKWRFRNCTRPRPQYGGENCTRFGVGVERIPCNVHWCPIHGNYSQWSQFSPCSTTCNNGTMVRKRSCTNPTPKYSGKNCSHLGPHLETRPCHLHECPIDGHYSTWGLFSPCTTTCGSNGTKIRYRYCDNPPPKFGGKYCSGASNETQYCNVFPCPIDGGWSTWSSYSRCSKTCESGKRLRSRTCDNPKPQYGGRNCTVISRERKEQIDLCNVQLCPDIVMTFTVKLTEEKWSNSLRNKDSPAYRKLARKITNNIEKFYNRDISYRKYRLLEMKKGSVILVVEMNYYNKFYLGIVDFYQQLFGRKRLDELSVEGINVTTNDVPSHAPMNVTMYNTSCQSIMITWIPSSGNITSYTVLHRVATENTTYHETVVHSEDSYVQLTNLKIFHPYTVIVYASNKRGAGVPTLSEVVWTEMEAPDAGPIVEHAQNVSSTSIVVRWSKIPKENVRGILLGLFLEYRSTTDEDDNVVRLNMKPGVQETVVDNLQKYSAYEVYLMGYNRIGIGSKGNTVLIMTDEDVPSTPPRNIRASNSSSTSVIVKWDDIPFPFIHGVLKGYIIYYKEHADTGDWRNITVNQNTVEISGLLKYHKYYIQLAGFTSKGVGHLSKTIAVMTDQDVPSGFPTGILAMNTSSTSILVQWNPIPQSKVHGVLQAYRVYYKRRALKYGTWKSKDVSPETRATELVGLKKFKKYDIQISGLTVKGIGLRSPNKRASTAEDLPTRPVAFLHAKATSSTTLLFKWGNIPRAQLNGILRGYKILYRVHDEQVIKTRIVLPIQNQFRLTGLLKYTTYGVRVIGFTIGMGIASSEVMVTTHQDTPSRPPRNIDAHQRWSSTTIPVTWQPISPSYFIHGILLGYRIKYKAVMNSIQRIVDKYKWITVSNETTGTTIDHLKSATTYVIQVLAFTSVGDGVLSNEVTAETCRCQNHFTTNWWELTPYTKSTDDKQDITGIFPSILQKAMDTCCRECKTKTQPKIHFAREHGSIGRQNGVLEVSQVVSNKIDFHFPIYGTRNQKTFDNDYPYVPLVQSPGVAFIVSSENSFRHSTRILNIVLGSWPLAVVIMLASYFIGVIMWLVECRSNNNLFPKSLLFGPWNGIWWSIVTLTTVGYGDKTPKTILGRLIAIIWPIVGQIFIATMIAQITSQLASGIIGMNIRIYGKKIAVIQNSSEYRLGIKKNAKFPDKSYTNLQEIYSDLINHRVFGSLLDTYTVASEQRLFNDETLSVNRIIKSSLQYGIVLGGEAKKLQPCLQRFLVQETDEVYDIVSKNVQPVKNVLSRNIQFEMLESLIDGTSDVYKTIIFSLLGVLSFGIMIGVIRHLIIKYVLPRYKDKAEVLQQARNRVFETRVNILRSWRPNKWACRLHERLRKAKIRHKNELKKYMKQRKKAEEKIQRSLKTKNEKSKRDSDSGDESDASSIRSDSSEKKELNELWQLESLEGLFSLV